MQDELTLLKEKVNMIEAQLQSLKTSESSWQEEQRESAFLSLIAEAEGLDSSLASRPSLTIALRPKTPKQLTQLFGGPTVEIVRLIEKGIEERQGGFGLSQAYPASKIVRGLYRLSISPGHDLRVVARDGSSVFIATAGPNFLSWAMKTEERRLILNPIALVEYIYSVSIFIRKIAELGGIDDCNWELITAWKNIGDTTQALVLPTGRVNTIAFMTGGHVAEGTEMRSLDQVSLAPSAETLAYTILKAIYNQAGASDAQIPYAVQGSATLDVPGLYAA